MNSEIVRKLINLWLTEINSTELEKISAEELRNIMKILKEKKKELLKMPDDISKELIMKEITILETVLGDLLEIRLMKIIGMLFESTKQENLLPHEKFFLNKLIELWKTSIRLAYEKELLSQKPIETLTRIQNIPALPTRRINTALVLLHKKIDNFVSTNLHIYRGLTANDIIAVTNDDLKTFSEKEASVIYLSKKENNK
ncbi:MAG: hypothetical protein ACTSUJ_08805 [Candidatus Njordarchaeales archaeon]